MDRYEKINLHCKGKVDTMENEKSRRRGKRMKKKVWIIGGGASGMMAAITAAKEGMDVTIAEHMDRVGKKILSTGNGRCNLTNLHQDARCYRSSQPDFPGRVLKQFSVDETISFFEDLGIVMKDRNGYLYPNSDQASSVLDVLRDEVERRKIRVFLNCQIKKAKAAGEHFVASPGEDIMDLNAVDEGKTPSIGACFAPIVVLLVLMFGIQSLTSIPSSYAVAIAMACAIIVGCVLYRDRLNVKEAVSNGAGGGLSSLIATSSIMGFGSVVSASPAYESITTALVNMDANPLITALISINVIAAITGSSAGGLNIFLSSMGEYLAASGLNMAMLHRVVCIASSGFDAMPHASGMVVCNQIAKTSQKDTYKYVFITCAIMPFCYAILACIIGTLGIV